MAQLIFDLCHTEGYKPARYFLSVNRPGLPRLLSRWEWRFSNSTGEISRGAVAPSRVIEHLEVVADVGLCGIALNAAVAATAHLRAA